MSKNRNIETKQAVCSVLKELKGRCVEAYNVIENTPSQRITAENISEKTLGYVRGLHAEIDNCNMSITTDENLLTSQFLSEMEAKICQVQELNAYTNGLVADVDSEINRLNRQIRTAEEALSRPHTSKQEIQLEHVTRAKECFNNLKKDLHGLIVSLFPDKADVMKEIMGNLMLEKLNGPSGYIQITPENFCPFELLRERSIVTLNPYNNMEAKLAV